MPVQLAGLRTLLIAVALPAAACRAADRRVATPLHGSATRVSSVASAALAASADLDAACDQTDGQRPDPSIRPGDMDRLAAWHHHMARGAEYHCVIGQTVPAVRLVLFGDTTIPSLDSIAVLPDSSGVLPLQVLPLVGDMPDPWNSDLIRMLDLDADSYNDLLVGASWGATGNVRYQVWRFNPVAHRFVFDSELSRESNPAPVPGVACVHTSGNSSALDDERTLRCLRDGHWVADSIETNTWDRTAHIVIHEISVRQGNSLVVMKRTARPDSVR